MKKIFKIIIATVCWIIGLILLYETIHSLIQSDPWGLTFTFFTLPIGITCILFLYEAYHLTKELIQDIK